MTPSDLTESSPLATGDQVQHQRFGTGHVELDKGSTAIVRFTHGLEECAKDVLVRLWTPQQAVQADRWDAPLHVITRVQAEAIRSVNDTWGVFSRSKIQLLPHQLWVCKRVNEQWPTRWLVADDVGLGKTIEAGLILSPLISRGRVKRLLVLCPASLVEQWQYRLRTMFDIRLAHYLPQADTVKSDFWGTHHQVVVSLQTLRDDRAGRHERLFDSEPWDLLVVDEAHHLNADEDSGPTLGYKLVDRLVQEHHVASMVFFTGTPHRGKDFGFLSLLRLLHPDDFDPRRPISEQLSLLSTAMIRNNKQNVTDLSGERLFRAPRVSSETYTFSEPEARFYAMLTEFILAGKAYASSLDSTNGRAVILVLIAMQKLASSSVAAVRRALKGRLQRIIDARRKLETFEDERTDISARNARRDYAYSEAEGDLDRLSKLEEKIAELSSDLRLMEDEEPRLEELVTAAAGIVEETKIHRLVELIERRFAGQQVVLFTEYKATQSLVMSALIAKYGPTCVTFINGDDRADEVLDASGKGRTLIERRDRAADRFNAAQVRFLVSTEAGGEGIDLQENSHCLIHVDLPWNPMRLHQRVGRLNRYGQKEQVEVVMLRNPQTVEALIWDKLNTKIETITRSLQEVMDEPEDLLDLVLGMTSPSMFREVFSDAQSVPRDSLSTWFDQRTASFGGRDVLDVVRQLVGNCASFDFKQASAQIPRVDLPDLAPFFKNALFLNQRRYREDGGGLSFNTPDAWRDQIGVRSNYENLIFDRSESSKDGALRVLGSGHRAFDQALEQALRSAACAATIPESAEPIVVFSVTDRVTGSGGAVRHVTVAWEGWASSPNRRLLRDWELLLRLNTLSATSGLRRPAEVGPRSDGTQAIEAIENASEAVGQHLTELDLPFALPELTLLAVFWPARASARSVEPESTKM
ncbi:MAG: RNA polymerase-associated protein RapA [Nitrospira sp.]|nr:RNA polymerase-associated protein RapA [Nitrospira sp.]